MAHGHGERVKDVGHERPSLFFGKNGPSMCKFTTILIYMRKLIFQKNLPRSCYTRSRHKTLTHNGRYFTVCTSVRMCVCDLNVCVCVCVRVCIKVRRDRGTTRTLVAPTREPACF